MVISKKIEKIMLENISNNKEKYFPPELILKKN